MGARASPQQVPPVGGEEVGSENKAAEHYIMIVSALQRSLRAGQSSPPAGVMVDTLTPLVGPVRLTVYWPEAASFDRRSRFRRGE
jgi:hypothetical protein